MPLSKPTDEVQAADRSDGPLSVALAADQNAQPLAHDSDALHQSFDEVVDRVNSALTNDSDSSLASLDFNDDQQYVLHLLQINGFESFADFRVRAAKKIVFLRLAPADYRDLIEFAVHHHPGDYVANIGRRAVKGARSFASAKFLKRVSLAKEISDTNSVPLEEIPDNARYVRRLLLLSGFGSFSNLEFERRERAIFLRLAPADYHELLEHIGRHHPEINRETIGREAKDGRRTFASPTFLAETSLLPSTPIKPRKTHATEFKYFKFEFSNRRPSVSLNGGPTQTEDSGPSDIAGQMAQAATLLAGRLPIGYWHASRTQTLLKLKYDEDMDDAQIAAFVQKFSGQNVSETTVNFHIEEADKNLTGQLFIISNSDSKSLAAAEAKYGQIFALTDREKAIVAQRILDVADKSQGPSPASEVVNSDIGQRVESNRGRLTRYARALERDRDKADDLVQDTITRALFKIHLWKEGTDLRAWLFTILHNQYVNQVRRSAREGIQVDIDKLADRYEHQNTAQEACSSRLELRDTDRALDKISPGQRAAILLVAYEGYRYQEAAEILGVPVSTVRSRLSRGREELRSATDRDDPDAQSPQIISPGTKRPRRTWQGWRLSR